MTITSQPNQIKFSAICWELLKVKGYVYLAGKPRSGKTWTAILIAEKSDKINSVLILTTKRAIGYPELKDSDGKAILDKDGMAKLCTNKNSPKYIEEDEKGWLMFINNNSALKHKYTVINYEQTGKSWLRKYTKTGKKLKNPVIEIELKLNPEDYQLVIIDESHNLGKVGAFNGRYKIIKTLCNNMPHIHLSGTAVVESLCGIYHQMSISKFSPFRHRNFYDFHREYGDPYYIEVASRDINQYDKAKPTLMPKIDEFTVYMTQEDAGISKDLQAVDKLHYIELDTDVKKLYNKLQELNIAPILDRMFLDGLYEKDSKDYHKNLQLVCDTTMKLRTSLHMLESGVAKLEEFKKNTKGKLVPIAKYIELGNTEKIDYIKEHFGDTEDMGIMCHFIGERRLLAKHFKRARIYSSTSHAEGVDLSHLSHFIIMSSGYSGSKFIQRRDSIVNITGSNTLLVHHILVKKAISEQVYKKTSKKEDFNNSTYEPSHL